MPRGKVVTVRTVEDIQGLAEKEDNVIQKQMAETVAKVIRSDDDGRRKVQIAIPRVSKAADEIVAQDYEIVEHDLRRITDKLEYEEIQEGVALIGEKLRQANEENARLRAENRYWRNCNQGAYPPLQQLHQESLLQNNESNIEDISAQLHEIKDWIHDIIQDDLNILVVGGS